MAESQASDHNSIMGLGPDTNIQVTSADMTNSQPRMLNPTIVSKVDANRKSQEKKNVI